MVIIKILNNNAIIARDESGKEFIMMGRGIAYKHQMYDEVDETLVERIFKPETKSQRNRLEALMAEIPTEYMTFVESLIAYVEEVLNAKFGDNLLIALTDHIYNSVQKYQQDILIPNMLVEEIKSFYEPEFKAATEIVHRINQKFSTSFDSNEAGFIAFHLINAQGKVNLNETIDVVKAMQHVIDMVKNHFNIDISKNAMDYSRFIVHMKFFFSKVISKSPPENKSLADDSLFTMLTEKYEDLNVFLNEVDDFTRSLKNYTLSDSDRMYLIIHLARLVYRK